MAVQRQDGLFADAKEAAEDLTGKEFYLATRTSAGKLRVCGEGEKVAGVISEGRAAGKHASINTGSQLKVVAGDPISVGDTVQSDSSGRAVTGSTNAFGVAISSVTAAGQMVEVDVDRT